MAEFKQEQTQKSGPSGATTKLDERESKFDEEGGAQPQTKTEHESEEELKQARDAEHDDKNEVPVGGQHNQQNPQLKKVK